MTQERKHITLIRLFLLLILAVYLGNVTLFNHTHVVNGTVIVHSHINTGAHSHSGQGIETIFFLSKILFSSELPTLPVPVLWLFLIGTMTAAVCAAAADVPPRGPRTLRAPPLLLF